MCLLVAALFLNAQLCRIVQTWFPSVVLRGVPGTTRTPISNDAIDAVDLVGAQDKWRAFFQRRRHLFETHRGRLEHRAPTSTSPRRYMGCISVALEKRPNLCYLQRRRNLYRRATIIQCIDGSVRNGSLCLRDSLPQWRVRVQARELGLARSIRAQELLAINPHAHKLR